ncbi:MAG: MBL fold metallo-hydrolase [Phycisphaerae bacterium]|nr:MBL fold metallo-hydrolase [Phycisphaerae bacterium]
MLTFTFLGVGGAFAKRNFQSNVLVEAWAAGPHEQAVPDDTLLIDFGSTGPLALYQLKDKPGFRYLDAEGTIRYPAIRRVVVTHQHSDHIGGLEEMALMNTFIFANSDTRKPFKPQLISSVNILNDLWDQSLKGGLNTIQGRYALLQDYFFILSLRPGDEGKDRFLLLKRYRISLFPTDHVQIERKYDWPSYGVFIEDTLSKESVFFSGDTRFDWPAYAPMMERASLCFHDVQLTEAAGAVHASIGELRTMPPAVKRKTWLYHYGDEWDSGPYDSVPDEFAGFVSPQERIQVLP